MRWMRASLVAGALVLGGCNVSAPLDTCTFDDELGVICGDVFPPAPETVEPEAGS